MMKKPMQFFMWSIMWKWLALRRWFLCLFLPHREIRNLQLTSQELYDLIEGRGSVLVSGCRIRGPSIVHRAAYVQPLYTQIEFCVFHFGPEDSFHVG